ncbi:MAG: PqqD family protein [Acidimicrobiales bacterium]
MTTPPGDAPDKRFDVGGIDETFVPRARSTLALAELDGEVVLLDEEQGVVHVLNATATLVWSRCDGSASLGEIVSELTASFGGDQRAVQKDVMAVVDILVRRGLVEHRPPSGGG